MWSEDIEENIIEYKWKNKWDEELARLTRSLHSRRPDPPAAPANPPFLWYKPFLNLSYSVRTRKYFYIAVKIGLAKGLATDVLSLLSRLMMIFKFPKLIGRARSEKMKNEFIFADTLYPRVVPTEVIAFLLKDNNGDTALDWAEMKEI